MPYWVFCKFEHSVHHYLEWLLTSLCAKTSCCLMPALPPYCASSHVRYRSTVRLNTDHSTPQINPRALHSSDCVLACPNAPDKIRLSSHVVTSSHLSTHLSQFCQRNGPLSRSSSSNSIPSCSSRIRFAICFEVPGIRRSAAVSVRAWKNCSNLPLMKVPSSRGPIFFRARRRKICSSFSRSIRCST